MPGAFAQHSGTALYASMIYAGVFLLAPRATPWTAAAAALAFCWLVESLQLTGLPAELSERSVAARLVLGVQFDPLDLAWYAAGVLPLAALHAALAGRSRRPGPADHGHIDRMTGVAGGGAGNRQ